MAATSISANQPLDSHLLGEVVAPSPVHDPGGKSKPKWPTGSVVAARFSSCQRYRYELSEIWNVDAHLVMFLMMNPSVAGIDYSDPTINRTGVFAVKWGFGGQLIGNIHAYRITDSKRLVEAADPVGPENDASLLAMAARASTVVLAYGQPPKALRPRGQHVVAMLRAAGVKLSYLRLSLDGTPQHPLYLPGSLMPLSYEG